MGLADRMVGHTYTITGHKVHCSLFVKETLGSRPKPESLGYLAGKNPNYTRSKDHIFFI